MDKNLLNKLDSFGDMVDITFAFTNQNMETFTLAQSKMLPEDDEDGLQTLCDSFLAFLNCAGYGYVKDIKLGIDDYDNSDDYE